MALRLRVVKNAILELRLRSGEGNDDTEIETEIAGGDILEIAIEIDFEINAISMILRLPEMLKVTPTLRGIRGIHGDSRDSWVSRGP